MKQIKRVLLSRPKIRMPKCMHPEAAAFIEELLNPQPSKRPTAL